MSRELLLLRHGESDGSEALGDFDRPITDRGKRGAQRIGVWLAREGLQPDLVITSPAERALVTAQKAIKAMGHGTQGIVEDRRIYAASASDLLEVLSRVPAEMERVLLVGHNPGLADLLSFLVPRTEPGAPKDGKLMSTGALARLALPDDWSNLAAGSGRLLSHTHPQSLPKKFPCPSPFGEEERDRPAYYYTQSSAIPYQITEQGVRILVISSSKKKHFVMPKGIKEPGLTPQDSAAKEAEEEAGVVGAMGDQSLGSYVYEKWGATVTVDVYPLEVREMIPDREWEERHRGRDWVSPEVAAAQVKQRELGPMILALAERIGAG